MPDQKTAPTEDFRYFPNHYSDARERFRENLKNLPSDAVIGQWKVPSATDEDLYVDHAYLSALEQAERLVVVISGVHGLEGYAGSAIQNMFMREILPQMDRNETGLLLIHALNPWGFRYHRRSTENHVNLNRNCSAGPELFEYRNPESLQLSGRFIPRTSVDSEVCHLVRSSNERNGRRCFDEILVDDFIKGVGIGQFESVKGLEFGGFAPEPQIRELTLKLREVMPKYKDIILCDLHTGLGYRGRLHLLTGDIEGCVDLTLFTELFRPEEDVRIYDFTPAETEGFYKTLGATNNLFPELARPDQRLCALTLEYGTLGHDEAALAESLNLWMLEHQGLFYGFKSPELEKNIRERYLEKFCPAAPEWKNQVVGTAREFFKTLLRRTHSLN